MTFKLTPHTDLPKVVSPGAKDNTPHITTTTAPVNSSGASKELSHERQVVRTHMPAQQNEMPNSTTVKGGVGMIIQPKPFGPTNGAGMPNPAQPLLPLITPAVNPEIHPLVRSSEHIIPV